MSAQQGPEQAVTMRDVAERLGVSTMTVSRALRGRPGIGEETRQRVLAEVAALGYRPNKQARSLRSGGPSELVGLVVTNLANPFYARLAIGLEEVCLRQGARVVLGSTGGDQAVEREVVADLLERGVDGLVVVPSGHDHSHLGGEQLRDTPVVLAAGPPMGIEADCVLVDDFGGTRAACRQLIARGHRRIGFLGLPPSLWTGSERFRGYAVALEEAGIALDERYVSRHRGDSALAEETARAMLVLPDPPTALLTANNRNTVGALRAVRAGGYPVALAGFDDIELADMLDVPLTVVSYDPAEVGRAAAALLYERREAAAAAQPRRVIVATTLVDHPRPRQVRDDSSF
ncbi:LacI family DNA-binding transcriptional regulator [Actinacidiphila acididurans]|uniref:LacI family DNA-binding transcriptional regulator n=1 Tax=Actinacidiphila acididurans TaxID=2784346 RepID=A0ABS2TL42_9ACTN|nr:LacI family DNA-binding transcriptional regulator [Actinacidiphila acididurans]MBM9504055.1 LacI family DNA-binding transcriptional regulator [Actinacidiphila acididurans]